MKTELDKVWATVRGPMGNTGDELEFRRAHAIWCQSIHQLCGPDACIECTPAGCIVLGVMEFFYKPKEN